MQASLSHLGIVEGGYESTSMSAMAASTSSASPCMPQGNHVVSQHDLHLFCIRSRHLQQWHP
jgi:hypothetical protein